MALSLRGEGFRFLFRTDRGVVNREVWWMGTAILAGIAALSTGIWFTISPYVTTDLSRRGLVDPVALGVYAYLMVHAFMILLTAICWYNLSAKRFRDRGRPPSLAGLPLVLAVFAGALHWLQPRVSETIPVWSTGVLDIVLLIVVLWTIYELGIRPAAETPRV